MGKRNVQVEFEYSRGFLTFNLKLEEQKNNEPCQPIKSHSKFQLKIEVGKQSTRKLSMKF